MRLCCAAAAEPTVWTSNQCLCFHPSVCAQCISGPLNLQPSRVLHSRNAGLLLSFAAECRTQQRDAEQIARDGKWRPRSKRKRPAASAAAASVCKSSWCVLADSGTESRRAARPMLNTHTSSAVLGFFALCGQREAAMFWLVAFVYATSPEAATR